MIVFPAVDIKDGQCVRLKQGKADEVTVFSADPVSQALHWSGLGARWLHVIDLDGAFSGLPRNFDLIKAMCEKQDAPVQLGGGVRDEKTAAAYFEAGVARLIVGTMALAEPEAFASLCAAFPGRIDVSLDAEDGRLKTKGWVEDSGRHVDEVVPEMEKAGAAFIVYTDIARDGMHAGVNADATEKLCRSTSLPVIAAGGVSTMEDIKAMHPLCALGLEGVITGRAIYSGTLDFAQALAWAREQS